MFLWQVEEDIGHEVQWVVRAGFLGTALQFPPTVYIPLTAELNRKITMEHSLEFWKFVSEM